RLKDIAMLAEETGRGFARDVLLCVYPSRKGHGIEPPELAWKMAFGEQAVEELKKEKLLTAVLRKKATPGQVSKAEEIIERNRKKAVQVVIALSHYSTSHTRFRDFLTRICGTRYASMPLFEVEMLEGAMNVDWKALARRTREIMKVINQAEIIGVKTPNGTHIEFSKKGRKADADTGILTRPGSFGNLPAGEVYLPPLEGTARGMLVVEWGPTRRLSSPITAFVENGSVVEVQGSDPYADTLREKLEERKENRNIAEFGIGTNENATRPHNILEAEKILGTIHIAFGDNSTFGGTVRTPFHQDFVFFRPTVLLTDREGRQTVFMKNGEIQQ
ncbi:MAG: aminopeptidase, partial [bacterium]